MDDIDVSVAAQEAELDRAIRHRKAESLHRCDYCVELYADSKLLVVGKLVVCVYCAEAEGLSGRPLKGGR